MTRQIRRTDMSRRLTSLAILFTLAAFIPASAPARAGPSHPVRRQVTGHEWGTFTSIAGADGHAVEWRPLAAPSDLPRFVDRLRFNVKSSLPAKVRMETPVLYFY